MNFTIVGAGYVGLSLAILISRKYSVTIVDTNKKKILDINSKKSPFKDQDISTFLLNEDLSLNATTNGDEAISNSNYVIIATPTNYDSDQGNFDTTSVEEVINQAIRINPKTFIIIKSTVPVGFTEEMKIKFKTENICFVPEFLREGSALHDNLYPSRIVVGGNCEMAKKFAEVTLECSNQSSSTKVFYMKSSEAEAVKLFSNTYLAMRVSFFNELDSFSKVHKLSTKNIINGVSSDSRIGNFYNNPSFGYGGYCLPKDTKQLLNNFDKIPNNIIQAIIDSNETRKRFIAESILNSSPKTVGVYRLTMKANSDNFRESAVFDVIKILQENNIEVNVYEPQLKKNIYNMCLIDDLDQFISKSDIIIANRMNREIEPFKEKIFTRDLFGDN